MTEFFEELLGKDGLIDWRDLIKPLSVRRIRRILYREGRSFSCFTNVRLFGIRIIRIQSPIDP